MCFLIDICSEGPGIPGRMMRKVETDFVFANSTSLNPSPFREIPTSGLLLANQE